MLIDCQNHLGADLLFYLHGDFPYSQQLVQMQHEGGALGITHWIAFPFVSYAAMDMTKFRQILKSSFLPVEHHEFAPT